MLHFRGNIPIGYNYYSIHNFTHCSQFEIIEATLTPAIMNRAIMNVSNPALRLISLIKSAAPALLNLFAGPRPRLHFLVRLGGKRLIPQESKLRTYRPICLDEFFRRERLRLAMRITMPRLPRLVPSEHRDLRKARDIPLV